MAGSMSRQVPENDATSGLDQAPRLRCETMIVLVPSTAWVKKTVRPSGVNAGEASDPAGQSASGANSSGIAAVDWAGGPSAFASAAAKSAARPAARHTGVNPRCLKARATRTPLAGPAAIGMSILLLYLSCDPHDGVACGP